MTATTEPAVTSDPRVAATSPPSDRIVSVDPMTLEPIGEVPVRDEAFVEAAVVRARSAQEGWWKLGLTKRLEVLARAKRIILDEMDEIADLVARECGKTRPGAIISEIFPSADLLGFLQEVAPRMLERKPLDIRLWKLARRESYLACRPIGVVGVISPWNFPFFLSMGATTMALAAGNAVILKPSEITPLTGEKIGEIFERAGLPDGVLTVASGAGATGRAVVERVDKIYFIGSDKTGRRILEAAAKRLTPCVMELGGNAPAIVLKDAALPIAARGLAWGAFFNAGQICASVQRIYVDEAVAKPFLDLFLEETRKLRLSPDRTQTDVGSLTCEMQLKVVEDLVADAKKRGAKVLVGGRRPAGWKGYFYEPTVLADVPEDARFRHEEVFGPVCMVETFTSEDDAIRRANDTRFGLTASLWTRDTRRGARLAEKLEAGSVTVNDHGVTAGMAETPWGGHKESGFGVIGSAEGLYEFVRRRHVHVNHVSNVPMPWWFPLGEEKRDAMKGIALALAGEGLKERFLGARKALKGILGA